MKRLAALAILAILVGAFAVGNYLPERDTQVKPQVPLDVKLKISSTPSLNHEFNLSFQAKPWTQDGEKQLDIEIQLPKGVKVVKGNLQQSYYNISPGRIINHELSIVITEPGTYSINGSAMSQWNPSYIYSKEDEICISVTETATEIIDCHPPAIPGSSQGTRSLVVQTKDPPQPQQTYLPDGKNRSNRSR